MNDNSWITTNNTINNALLNQGGTNILNNDVNITILNFKKQEVSDPNIAPIEYKPIYEKFVTTGNCQRFKTDKLVTPTNEMAYGSIEYRFVVYESADICGINANTENGGSYIVINKEEGLWYKVKEIIQSNQTFCEVKCIQTSQDPEKPNTNKGDGINIDKLMWEE